MVIWQEVVLIRGMLQLLVWMSSKWGVDPYRAGLAWLRYEYCSSGAVTELQNIKLVCIMWGSFLILLCHPSH